MDEEEIAEDEDHAEKSDKVREWVGGWVCGWARKQLSRFIFEAKPRRWQSMRTTRSSPKSKRVSP